MPENLLAVGIAPDVPAGGAYSALPEPLAGGEGTGSHSQERHPRSRPPTLALLASVLASPNPFTKIRLYSEVN